MLFDVFFSICQAEVDGHIPSEKTMYQNFFEQVKAADLLGYSTAWLAESHLSCEVQKKHKDAVIPNFKGEIGLNTDILLMASKIFSLTKKIHVGSAIRSLLVNGGPIAHAEAVKTFLALHSLNAEENRKLHLGFAAGRFAFSSKPYGIVPRTRWEELAWGAVKGKIFLEATEVFLRFLRGDVFSSAETAEHWLTPENFRNAQEWSTTLAAAKEEHAEIRCGENGQELAIRLPNRWFFPVTGVIPKETPLDLLELLIGSHDAGAQILANSIMPCGVFNLSITPAAEIEETHQRMQSIYHKIGRTWHRGLMPRTVLVFLNCDPHKSPEAQRMIAQEQANTALLAYWSALENTIDEQRIKNAVHNALVGNAEDVAQQICERFHPQDRLMLWFDFYNHNSAAVITMMENFMNKVVPLVRRHLL